MINCKVKKNALTSLCAAHVSQNGNKNKEKHLIENCLKPISFYALKQSGTEYTTCIYFKLTKVKNLQQRAVWVLRWSTIIYIHELDDTSCMVMIFRLTGFVYSLLTQFVIYFEMSSIVLNEMRPKVRTKSCINLCG